MVRNKKIPLKLQGELTKETGYKYSTIVNSEDWEKVKAYLLEQKQRGIKILLEADFYKVEKLVELNRNCAYINALDDLIKIIEQKNIINNRIEHEDTP